MLGGVDYNYCLSTAKIGRSFGTCKGKGDYFAFREENLCEGEIKKRARVPPARILFTVNYL